jgi:hypothetical protein
LLDYRRADKVFRVGLDSLLEFSKKGDAITSSSKRRESVLSEVSFNASPSHSRQSQLVYSRARKELQSLQSLYERFCNRMMKRVEEEAVREINEIRRNSMVKRRSNLEEIDSLREQNEKLYGNKRQSYTKNQIILGGIPIYVDNEFRDEVIPQGTQAVEVFYDVLKEIDCF